MKKICMIVQDKAVKGGIAAVISGYYGSRLEKDYSMIYVESYKDGGKFAKIIKAIQGYIKFAKVLIIDKPDLIHIHSSFGPSFYRKIPFIYMSSWAGKPIINHIHGADFNEFYENSSEKKKKQIKKVYNKCNILIALSEEWKQHLMKIVPENKIAVIENYSILHEDALQERCARKSNHIILFLGELGKRKGCYDIPYVVEQVSKEIPDVKFILAGAGTTQDEVAIKQLIKEKGIEQHVEFPGWVRGDQKDQLLRDADVFYLPSYNEGMPMSILDAMGYGLPIVSTKVGGIPKIVFNEKNGFCLEPGNIKEMGKAIIALIEVKRIETSISSFEIVKNGYSLEQHLKKLEKCYSNTFETSKYKAINEQI